MLKVLNLNRLDNIKNTSQMRVRWVNIAITIILLINIVLGYFAITKEPLNYNGLVEITTDGGTSRGFFISATLVLTEARVGKNLNSPVIVSMVDGGKFNGKLLASGYNKLMDSYKLGNREQSLIADNWSLVDIGESGSVESYFLIGSHNSMEGSEELRVVTKDEMGEIIFRDGSYEKTGPKNYLWSIEVRETDIGSPLLLKETGEVIAIPMDLNLSYLNNDFPNIKIVPIDRISNKCEAAGYPIY